MKNNYKFTINGNEYEVDIIDFEEGIAILEVNGTPYKVEVHQEVKQSKTPTLVRKEIPTARKESKIKKSVSSLRPIKAPLPGNIMKIFVKEGDEIKKGDKLLIYEAMKMENNLLSEKEGIVKAITVKEGDAVLQDDILMEIA
jgi:glutaconyl-CoA/methylmalonyl-CoA decarboxylase subunit gamma